MAVHLFGIRHHGPGSARRLLEALERIRPDILLVEGPPEGEDLLSWAEHPHMQPPVALLAYRPDEPQDACFYPFAEFSPEWQAISYALRQRIPLRFMDLPLRHLFALREKLAGADNQSPAIDPMEQLARADGWTDHPEQWWEYRFEDRRDATDVFEAIQEAMKALREQCPDPSLENAYREAYMRQIIRQTRREFFVEIAVVCGAWHLPALEDSFALVSDDEALLRKLPSVKVQMTWVPWTYDRMSLASGYGAGIFSPGWYQHLYQYPADSGARWMSRVAALFRFQQLDISPAQVLDGVRLARDLAAIRGRSHPGLTELNEAAVAVMCGGEPDMLSVVRRELIISNVIGKVPEGAPRVPLQADLERLQRSLRLQPQAEARELPLDLREEGGLARSTLLHRLQILGIDWGELRQAGGRGTFRELWRLEWKPEFPIRLIECGVWGNTLEEASAAFALHRSENSHSLPAVAGLLEQVLPAALPIAAALVQRIDALAASTGDLMELMNALPPLIRLSRYGDVRRSDTGLVAAVAQRMLARLCIGLPSACAQVDESSAVLLSEQMDAVQQALDLWEEEERKLEWYGALQNLAPDTSIQQTIAGHSLRLLHDRRRLDPEETARLFQRALSKGGDSRQAAAWLRGFLRGSALVLLLDETLFGMLRNWVREIDEVAFVEVLPLLRRTFSAFSAAERRQIGARAAQAPVAHSKKEIATADFNSGLAAQALDILDFILSHRS